jgi:hypothetical protein
MFVIAAEGVKTEPQYFALLNDLHAVIHVTCLKAEITGMRIYPTSSLKISLSNTMSSAS